MHRKSRNKIDKDTLDFSEPIELSKLGTSEDPCFGKFHDTKAKECQRCGDSEMCVLVQGQNNHLKRAKLEKKENFKDTQQLEAPEHTEADVEKYLRRKLKKYPKDKNKVIRLGVKKFKPYVSKFEIEGKLNEICKRKK